jgi:hypothetical protein
MPLEPSALVAGVVNWKTNLKLTLDQRKMSGILTNIPEQAKQAL